MSEADPVKVEDFAKLAPLVKAYELKQGNTYLIVCGGKEFKNGLAEGLFRRLREFHPDLNVYVVATMKPKAIEVREHEGSVSPGLAGGLDSDPAAGPENSIAVEKERKFLP